MNEQEWLAERFEENRPHLEAVAYRMLGSLSEAEDAVQEAWLRLQRSDEHGIANLGGWLTTVVSLLEAVAYRMLGSLSEAEDAVQEAWLRLQRSDEHGIANLGGWLTTVVSRVE